MRHLIAPIRHRFRIGPARVAPLLGLISTATALTAPLLGTNSLADESDGPMPVWVWVGYGLIALFFIAGGLVAFAIASAAQSRNRIAAIDAAEAAADAEYRAAQNSAGHDETAHL